MSRGDRGFIYGRWYIGYRGFSISVSRTWEWGYEEDWYDGPLHFFGIGFLHFAYVP